MWRAARVLPLIACATAACGPIVPEAESVTSGRTGETKVTVTRTDPSEESASGPSTDNVAASQSIPAKPIDPPPNPSLSPSIALVGGAAGDAPLPLPTVLAAAKGTLFAFGRTRSGWIVRALPQKGKAPTWSKPVVVTTAFDDDTAFAIGDGEVAWFGVSSVAGGVRIARVDGSTKVTTIDKVPGKLGSVASFVPLKAHVAVIGRDVDAITFARLDRTTGFLDTTARVLARGAIPTSTSRSPRATSEDDKVLLAWDADDVSGALPAPGTTAAEKAAPKPGIYVRRFHASGDPASPARRLTRPSFEAHALDVVVELGACAVLASTPDGFEMFRFVRKGDDLSPYGGGLHLAPPGGDVALGADVIGTIGVTSSKLLRIGPGIKIVPSPLGFSPPPGGAFDHARIAMDGYGAHVLFSTRTALGPQPTIARIDGEHMGPILPTPWVGPPPQKLLFAALDGDEALALVVGGAALSAVRLGADGALRSTTPVPVDSKELSAVAWPNAPVPRAARAGNEWVVALRDGRALIATGPRAGAIVPLLPPGQSGGALAFVPTQNHSASLRVVYVPPGDKAARLFTTTLDPKQAAAANWTPIPGSEHYYGALGGARFTALPRASGGIVLLTSSGPKVSMVAQLYGLVAVDELGHVSDVSIEAPVPIQDLSLVPTLGGAALVATLTGKGVAARWIDGPVKGWRESFAYTPFRARGDGPIVRDKGIPRALSAGALPIDLTGDVASYVGDRCPFAMPTGARSMLLACEEGSGDSPLAARATVRVLRF